MKAFLADNPRLKLSVVLVGDSLLGFGLACIEHPGLQKVVLGEGLGGEIEGRGSEGWSSLGECLWLL